MQLKNLTTKFLGKDFSFYEEIDSSQLEIWRRIENKTIKNGTLLSADIQTKGKGTHGRTWRTDEKNNIAFSFALEVNCEAQKLEGITIEIAKVLVEIFHKLYGISLEIKSPNDLVYRGKKLGGILTEVKTQGKIVKYVVIGIRYQHQPRDF